MSWEKSEVMSEFLKIAAEKQDLLGLRKNSNMPTAEEVRAMPPASKAGIGGLKKDPSTGKLYRIVGIEGKVVEVKSDADKKEEHVPMTTPEGATWPVPVSGSAKTAAAVEPNPYQEDLKTIVEKRIKSPDKHIMEEAHPDPVYTAEGRGDGGLVENEIEHQKKMIEVVNKMPTGSLVGRYAASVMQMVKLADQADALGYYEAADQLTAAANEMLGKLSPLV